MHIAPSPIQETRVFPHHEDFNRIFQVDPTYIAHYFGPQFANGYQYEICAKGDFEGDIKSNDCDLVFSCILQGVKENVGANSLFSVGIRRFTGNCGFKAIDHFRVFHAIKKNAADLLLLVESFAYHYCNCGYLIGSDDDGYGLTGNVVRRYGKDWCITPSIWNPNYTWDLEHKVFMFYKDLTNRNYPNYWGTHPNEPSN